MIKAGHFVRLFYYFSIMDKVAEEIINRFKKSWQEVEQFYIDLISNYSGFERLKAVLSFIQKLSLENQNIHFRLGTSIHRLIISRSVEYGLRSDQKYILIDVDAVGNYEVTLKDGERIYRSISVQSLNDEKVTDLLNILKSVLIN